MLTEQFYIQLATLLKDGPSEWGPLSVAVGRGAADWDRFPPALQRDITGLQDEVARTPVPAGDIVFLDSVRNSTETPTEILRIAAHLTPGSVSGTLRECGLFSGEDAESVLLAYFVHPRLDLRPVDALDRYIQLDLRPGRSRVEEHIARYLGNSKSEELHDLERATASCQIGEIRVDRRHYFASIEEALALGYDYCARCFGRELSER